MPSSTASEPIVVPKRHARRTAVGIAAASVALLLSACTPSGYRAERYAVSAVNYFETGADVHWEDVDCEEFESTVTNRYEGLCRAGDEVWAVLSTYNESHTVATVTAYKWDLSMIGSCEVRKSGGQWVIQGCW
jgi:hypothetical protein